MNSKDALAIVRVEDLVNYCSPETHSGFKGFLIFAGLIGVGVCVRGLMKRVDKLEERCHELESKNDILKSDNKDDFFSDDEILNEM